MHHNLALNAKKHKHTEQSDLCKYLFTFCTHYPHLH